jgi:hypothetical protein
MTEKSAGLTEARAAKQKAKRILDGIATVTGIGLTRRGGTYAVKILLSEALENPEKCPDTIDGVPVVLQVVGHIRKQPRSRKSS